MICEKAEKELTSYPAKRGVIYEKAEKDLTSYPAKRGVIYEKAEKDLTSYPAKRGVIYEKAMNSRLLQLIKEGEHQRQDFKFCINDSRKIARSLVAFANTDGGILLIGVKDNGHIVGVQSEEEYYMVESAAKIYSKPAIPFITKQWHVEGKTVLEVKVEPSNLRPHFARDENGKWLAYIRHHDEDKLASKVLLDVWRKRKSKEGILVHLEEAEKFLLDYLKNNDFITVGAFARKACISYRKAEQLLADFIVIGIVQPYYGENKIFYQLNRKFNLNDWEARRYQ